MIRQVPKIVLTLLICTTALLGQTSFEMGSFRKSGLEISAKERAEIIRGLFDFFSTAEDCDLATGHGLFFKNAPKRFSKQFINELRRKKCGSRFRLLTVKEIAGDHKISYLGIVFKSKSRNKITIYVNSYSSCYEIAYYYYFKKKDIWRYRKELRMISECGFGCKDGVCLPSLNQNPISVPKPKKITEEDAPPPIIKRPIV